MTRTDNRSFFDHLPEITDFSMVADFERYTPLPGDWYVIFSDIENSTSAVAEGNYKSVNVMGASVITAVSNCYPSVDLPYSFGGDGAVVCVPPGQPDRVKNILAYLKELSRHQFNLSLRAGLVKVDSLRERGYDLKVAKYRISEHIVQAFFTGDAIAYGEKMLKEARNDPAWIISEDRRAGEADLSKLECRWENHDSRYDEIITLLVAVTESQEGKRQRIYRKVVHTVNEIYCNRLECHPIQNNRLKLSFRLENLSVEQKLKTYGAGWWTKTRHLVSLYFKQAAGLLLTGLGMRTRNTDWGQYKKDLKKNSDYRKYDGCLRQVLSGTVKQRRELIDFLEDQFGNGRLAYGLSTSPSVIITCLVNNYRGDHLHFVDGTNGGYAVAAEELKQRLNEMK